MIKQLKKRQNDREADQFLTVWVSLIWSFLGSQNLKLKRPKLGHPNKRKQLKPHWLHSSANQSHRNKTSKLRLRFLSNSPKTKGKISFKRVLLRLWNLRKVFWKPILKTMPRTLKLSWSTLHGLHLKTKKEKWLESPCKILKNFASQKHSWWMVWYSSGLRRKSYIQLSNSLRLKSSSMLKMFVGWCLMKTRRKVRSFSS